ncbi:MAG: sugar transferase [Candidatus Saccharibacteria bacterium]|nr:sugar transferase [Candidatus Saccharibacteria bacterium]
MVDIAVAAVMLALLVAPMLVVATIIKLTSAGPVLFRQQRYGKDKKPFTVYKFRSMAKEAPADQATNSFANADSFITPVGKIMRKLSIDELPQLINVLRGDMSVIGPRPVILAEKSLIDLRDRYGANSVRPGVTGWAQINGRDELSDAKKAAMDGEYVQKMSAMMDIKILLKTALVVISMAGQREGSEQREVVGLAKNHKEIV